MRAKAAFLTREAGIQFTNPVLSVCNPGRRMACPGVFCFCGGGKGREAALPRVVRGGVPVAGGWFAKGHRGAYARGGGLRCVGPVSRPWVFLGSRGVCIFFTRGFVHGG